MACRVALGFFEAGQWPCADGLATAALAARSRAGEQRLAERRRDRGRDDAAGGAGPGLRPAGELACAVPGHRADGHRLGDRLAGDDPGRRPRPARGRLSRCARDLDGLVGCLRPAFPRAGRGGSHDQPLLALLPRVAPEDAPRAARLRPGRGQLLHLGVLHRHRRRLPGRRLRRQVPGLPTAGRSTRHAC